MSAKKMMEFAEEPLSFSNKLGNPNNSNANNDLHILCEGFKYTLREWRRWTHDEIEIDDGYIITRGEYSMTFIKYINSIFNKNGYVLLYKLDSIARRFMHYWMQLYNSNGGAALLPGQHHNGTKLEYEEWDRMFSMEFWENVTQEFIVYKGFDETAVGRELLYHIGDFFWNYVDVTKSPMIVEKREEERRIEEEMKRWVDDPSESNKLMYASATITPKDKTDEVSDKEY
jgi:hypothetical protein